MASYVKKTITCVCCNEKYEVDMLKGYSVDADIDLDTNPHNPALYDRVVLCPKCGFATVEPYTDIDNIIRSFVYGENYRELLAKKGYDNTCKKLLLAGYLAAKRKNMKEAGYLYLLAFWYLKEKHSDDAPKACEKAIKHFERYLNSNMDLEVAMILVDLLRQMGHFADAFETISYLEQYLVTNKKLLSIAVFEKGLISHRDSKVHRMSEVTM